MSNFGIVSGRIRNRGRACTETDLVGSLPVFVYHGGPLITSALVYAFYWGRRWVADSTLQNSRTYIDQFLGCFLSGSSIVQLAEYSTPAYSIGTGVFHGPSAIIPSDPAAIVTDDDLRNVLTAEMNSLGITVTPNSLFMVFLPPGVEIDTPEGRSCRDDLCGYHSDINGIIFYGVVPYPCKQCAFTNSDLANITSVSSHEICEMITDPISKTGWWDPVESEIGDVCVNKLKQETYQDSSGNEIIYVVQKEWSNKQRKCI